MERETIPYGSEEEWLELRAKDITSSESSALFGLNPYTTELELYHLKKSGSMKEIKATGRMKWGNRLEKSISEGAAEELGLKVIPLKTYKRIPVIRMGASFDFEILEGAYNGYDLKDWVMEIKNVDSFIFKQNWNHEENEATDYINVQVQHQLEVADRPGCLLVVLVGGNEIKYQIHKRDKSFGLALTDRIKQFWHDVHHEIKPEPDYEKDADFIISLHQLAGHKAMDANEDESFLALIEHYVEEKARIKEHEAESKALKAKILEAIGDDYSKVLLDGYNISCGMSKGSDPTLITPEMVGQEYGGRKGFRNLRITEKISKGGK